MADGADGIAQPRATSAACASQNRATARAKSAVSPLRSHSWSTCSSAWLDGVAHPAVASPHGVRFFEGTKLAHALGPPVHAGGGGAALARARASREASALDSTAWRRALLRASASARRAARRRRRRGGATADRATPPPPARPRRDTRTDPGRRHWSISRPACIAEWDHEQVLFEHAPRARAASDGRAERTRRRAARGPVAGARAAGLARGRGPSPVPGTRAAEVTRRGRRARREHELEHAAPRRTRRA